MHDFFNDLTHELQRAMDKPTPEERSIAVRVIMEAARPKLTEMEHLAKEQAIQLVNSMIMDVVDAPGCDSPFRGFSTQDVLVLLRKRLMALGDLPEGSFDSSELDRRLKERARRPHARHDPRQSKP